MEQGYDEREGFGLREGMIRRLRGREEITSMSILRKVILSKAHKTP